MVFGILFSLQDNLLNITSNPVATNYGFGIFIENFLKQPSTSSATLASIVMTKREATTTFVLAANNFGNYSTETGNFSNGYNNSLQASMSSKNHFLPIFETVLGTITYLVIIAMTVIGNSLVVISVFSYRPLKKVQNYFLVSLAFSDLCVAIIVMPLHVVKFLANGRWLLGVTICQLFTTADILLCTASIWNLCAIAIDRYWAIHDPIDYAQKRTLKFVCTIILLVWLGSACISIPPIIGWNDWSSQKLMEHCELTTEKAFVVFSASASFFVPLALMIVVYVKIFISARDRIRTNRGRSALLRINRLSVNNDSNATTNTGPHLLSRIGTTTASALATVTSTTSVAAQILQHEGKNGMLLRRSSAANLSNGTGQKPKKSPSQRSNSAALVPISTTNNKKLTKLPQPSVIITCECPSTKSPNDNDFVLMSDENTTTTTRGSDESAGHLANNDKTAHLTVGNFDEPPHSTTITNKNPQQNSEEQLTTTVLKNREKISVAKEKRAAKTIAVIIFVFTFCWLPFFCAYLILPFCDSCTLHPKVHQAFVWLGYINSSLNPFLYGILNLEFRRAFRKILCPKRFLNSRKRWSIAAK